MSPLAKLRPNYMLQQTGATNRLVVSQHQVAQDQDHEPAPESPLQLNMGVSQQPTPLFALTSHQHPLTSGA